MVQITDGVEEHHKKGQPATEYGGLTWLTMTGSQNMGRDDLVNTCDQSSVFLFWVGTTPGFNL